MDLSFSYFEFFLFPGRLLGTVKHPDAALYSVRTDQRILLFLPNERECSFEHESSRKPPLGPSTYTQRSGMIRLRRQQAPLQSHTQNSVERPQNRHLKPFKSRAELNGQLDPRAVPARRLPVSRRRSALVDHDQCNELRMAWRVA